MPPIGGIKIEDYALYLPSAFVCNRHQWPGRKTKQLILPAWNIIFRGICIARQWITLWWHRWTAPIALPFNTVARPEEKQPPPPQPHFPPYFILQVTLAVLCFSHGHFVYAISKCARMGLLSTNPGVCLECALFPAPGLISDYIPRLCE